MLIRDQFKGSGPTLSFEFFPPKDDVGFWDLFKTIESLKPLSPTFVSVTYGAGGSTRRKTIDLVTRIKRDIGIEPMAHLTCVGADRAEIVRILEELKSHGIKNVLALRGDPPQGQEPFKPSPGGFRYANELVELIREQFGDLCVGAACCPEGHPEAPSLEVDLVNLKRKVDAGVDFLISQLFFNNDDFLAFRDRAIRSGINVPMIAGIMPILSVKQIKKFTQMCGAGIPADLLRKIEQVEDDAEAVRQIGMYHAAKQCMGLLAEGAAGIHFYTLNRSTATRAIYQEIRSSLSSRTP